MADIRSCPRCGAINDEDAAKRCSPVEDQCPMTCCDDWDDALAELNRRATWEPPSDVHAGSTENG